MGYYLNDENNLTFDEIPNPIFGKEKTIVILQTQIWSRFYYENKTIISKEIKCPKKVLKFLKRGILIFYHLNAKTIMI